MASCTNNDGIMSILALCTSVMSGNQPPSQSTWLQRIYAGDRFWSPPWDRFQELPEPTLT